MEPNIGLDEEKTTGDLGLGNVIDFDDLPEDDGQNIQVDEQDLMASLDSILQEIQEDGNGASTDYSEYSELDTMFTGSAVNDNRGAASGTEGLHLEPEEEAEEEAEEGGKKKAKKAKKEKKPKKEKPKKEPKEKLPFAERIKKLFFRVEVIEPLSEEEEEKQKALKKQEKEEKKKAADAAKKQKAAEKKEAAKKKKEEAAAKKAAKPKKEKKPKPPKEPVSPEEIVHIRPMFLIFLLSVTAAILLVTITLSNSYGYQLAVNNARKYLERNDYEEAFQELNGLAMNSSDEALYESARILMRVEKQYRSYVNYSLLDMPNEALDSLLKAVKNYDSYFDVAEGYGVKEELDGLLSNVEYALDTYGLDLATAREWNTFEDSNEYTRKIMTCTGSY